LVLAASFIHADGTERDDLLAVGELKVELTGRTAKHHGGQLGIGVFECEIDVTGGRGGEVGNFAFNPQQRKLTFEQRFETASQFADAENLGGRRHNSRLRLVIFVREFRFHNRLVACRCRNWKSDNLKHADEFPANPPSKSLRHTVGHAGGTTVFGDGFSVLIGNFDEAEQDIGKAAAEFAERIVIGWRIIRTRRRERSAEGECQEQNGEQFRFHARTIPGTVTARNAFHLRPANE